MIPKPGGGQRPLGIPAIPERVTQSAVKLVIEPVFEADLDPEAYSSGANQLTTKKRNAR